MAVPPVTYQVNDDIVLVLLAVLCRKFKDLDDIVKRIGIHVKNWAIKCFGKIRTVNTRSRLGRVCGEPDLVVNDNVDGPTDFVVW